MNNYDLQIGDYVTYKNDIVKVHTLMASGSKLTVSNENNLSDVLYSDIVPVTITEEILKKNGFKHVKEFRNIEEYISPDRRVTISSVSNAIDRNWYAHIDNEDMESIGGCDIQYVHQLQQILRLCGIKKEIIL